jgi:hypothetical protein
MGRPVLDSKISPSSHHVPIATMRKVIPGHAPVQEAIPHLSACQIAHTSMASLGLLHYGGFPSVVFYTDPKNIPCGGETGKERIPHRRITLKTHPGLTGFVTVTSTSDRGKKAILFGRDLDHAQEYKVLFRDSEAGDLFLMKGCEESERVAQ